MENDARVPAAPTPELLNSANTTPSVLGVEVDQISHPAGLMVEPKVDEVKATLEERKRKRG